MASMFNLLLVVRERADYYAEEMGLLKEDFSILVKEYFNLYTMVSDPEADYFQFREEMVKDSNVSQCVIDIMDKIWLSVDFKKAKAITPAEALDSLASHFGSESFEYQKASNLAMNLFNPEVLV